MFGDGRFFTPSGKARLLPIEPRSPVNGVDESFPFILNTGRVRDQWHTMTRTGKSPRLSEHSPEPYVSVHPEDAARAGVQEAQLVRLFSRWGEMIGRCRIDEGQRRGELFAPMHWNEQFASRGRVDAVVNPELDPLSGQPELKHTPVRLLPFDSVWHGFILSRRKLQPEGVSYWAQATGDGFFRYELAGEQMPGDWSAWARGYLCSADNDVNWVELLDVGAQKYRGVRMVGERMESCIFIAPDYELPSRSWLASLFEKTALTGDERRALLTGKPPVGQIDAGRVVCACFHVGERTIRDAIDKQGLSSVEQISACTKAGTGCGSCVAELKGMLP
jgi:assimilatory nitrate reductase catalytic subunit